MRRLEVLGYLGVLLIAASASAATWTVDDDGADFPGADFSSIQDAIDAAADGDEVLVYPGTYTRTGDWVINPLGKAITIRSSDGLGLTILDGEDARRVVLCDSGETATTVIEGFTITGGHPESGGVNGAGGGASCSSSPAWIDCRFTNNTASHGGGMFCYYNDGNPTLTNCTFDGNTADYGGGLQCEFESNPALYGCNFTNNTAIDGAGVLCHTLSNPLLVDCNFTDNPATGRGGGVFCYNNGNPTLTNCTFDANSAVDEGGGMYCFYNCSPTLTNCIVTNNSAMNGGGLYTTAFNQGNSIVTNCTFEGNSALAYGGGIYLGGNNMTMTSCTMAGNTAPTGAGIFASYAATISFAGTSTSDATWCQDVGTTLSFSADSILDVTGGCTPPAEGALSLDLDDLDATTTLLVSGTLTRQGCLAVTNSSGSLATAEAGDLFPLATAGTLAEAFTSIVLPAMPDGLGLQLVEQASLVGGDTIAIEVIDVDGADFSDPFSEGLDSEPVDIVSFDADGDGADEIAVLFGGSPGGVGVYSVSEDAPPVLINGLVELVGNGPVDLDAGDLNGDGLDDLLVANGADSTLSVLQTQEDIVDGSLYFDVSTIAVPGSGQTLTCAAIIDWEGDALLDAVAGVDRVDPAMEDAWQVMLDVATAPSAGSTLLIDKYLTGESMVADPPAAARGDAAASWGFVGGTRYGRIQRAKQATGTLETIDELGGNRVVTIEAVDMDGDGIVDILATSDEAESIYLLAGSAAEPDGFGDLIPIAVSEPVEDVVVLDVDADGDMDMIMASPTSANYPLLLLRNDGASGGALVQPLGGIVWSMQGMASGGSPHRLAGGMLNNKDDDDDWVIGGGGGLGFGGETGVLEQTNLLGDTGGCPEDIDGNGTVNIDDLLLVLGNYNGTGEGDVDGNGVVNIDDMLLVIGAWNASC